MSTGVTGPEEAFELFKTLKPQERLFKHQLERAKEIIKQYFRANQPLQEWLGVRYARTSSRRLDDAKVRAFLAHAVADYEREIPAEHLSIVGAES